MKTNRLAPKPDSTRVNIRQGNVRENPLSLSARARQVSMEDMNSAWLDRPPHQAMPFRAPCRPELSASR
ncbi:hypothetical protein ACFYYR_07720 [Streptomyces sp. NPDC001922]|uniref:hypothetical protein n=1 Tax=Streptomyces sp. NPDC001922 TaxID=3364624 RepID=UPI0036AE419E